MEIKGDGFILRGWLPADAASLQKHADNPNVSRFLLNRFPSPYTLTDAKTWIQILQYQEPRVNFAIAIDGEVVGGIGLELRDDVYRKTPLLGYWLSEQYWGYGIMPHAVRLITDYAFNYLDAICVLAYVLSKNLNSMRVLEKAGFTKQGIIRQSVIKNEEVMDEHVYGISKQI